ncbi:hypothetical protein [Williamsia limnetica]|uniref:hypothetical protein n=1 Tax=Williamsia limnetica TaxID=882452 RepID=UPI00319DC8FA
MTLTQAPDESRFQAVSVAVVSETDSAVTVIICVDVGNDDGVVISARAGTGATITVAAQTSAANANISHIRLIDNFSTTKLCQRRKAYYVSERSQCCTILIKAGGVVDVRHITAGIFH